MKDGIHPNYRDVCFQDMSNGFKFVTRSCANTKEMITLEDGRELPLTQSGMAYLATAVLPKRLRKRSTRPPNVSMDFCVPV